MRRLICTFVVCIWHKTFWHELAQMSCTLYNFIFCIKSIWNSPFDNVIIYILSYRHFSNSVLNFFRLSVSVAILFLWKGTFLFLWSSSLCLCTLFFFFQLASRFEKIFCFYRFLWYFLVFCDIIFFSYIFFVRFFNKPFCLQFPAVFNP